MERKYTLLHLRRPLYLNKVEIGFSLTSPKQKPKKKLHSTVSGDVVLSINHLIVHFVSELFNPTKSPIFKSTNLIPTTEVFRYKSY